MGEHQNKPLQLSFNACVADIISEPHSGGGFARASDGAALKRVGSSLLIYVSLLGEAAFLLWKDKAFLGEFGGYPDEAGHYVTGLMVHDYVTSLHYLQPLKFAENYYLHYPKVALGHWPPVFYLIQTLWTLIFSVSHTSLMLLMVVLTGLLGFAIYQLLVDEFGTLVSFAAALVFVALPVVQAQTQMVMADISVALFSLLAAQCFGRFLDTERARDVLLFGVYAALAIMTKGNAMAISLLPPTAIFLARKWRLLWRPSLWGSAAIVLVTCAPWYILTLRMQSNGLEQPSSTAAYSIAALGFYSADFVSVLGWGLAALAMGGLLWKLYGLFRTNEIRGMWAAIGGLAASFLILCCAVPTGTEDRYLLPVIPAAIAFAVAELASLGSKIRSERLKPAVLTVILVSAFAVSGFSFASKPSYGFGQVAKLLDSSPQFHDAVILVSSDSIGEGMLISEVAMRERRPGHVVLRASKVLAESQWSGQNYHPLFSTPQEIDRFLLTIPVTVVILDDSIRLQHMLKHEILLKQAIGETGSNWKVFESFSVWRNGVEFADALHVYVLNHGIEKANDGVRINMQPMLGENLTLPLSDSSERK